MRGEGSTIVGSTNYVPRETLDDTHSLLGDGGLPAETPVDGVCLLVDVSEGGVGFCTALPLPIGGRVFVEVTTKAIEFSAVGRVVHSAYVAHRHYRAGLRFEAVPPNDRLLLSRALCGDETR